MLPAKRRTKTVTVKDLILEFDSAMPDHAIEKDVLQTIDEINNVLRKHMLGPLPQISINSEKLNLQTLPIPEYDEEES
jgi:hypothetical protein